MLEEVDGTGDEAEEGDEEAEKRGLVSRGLVTVGAISAAFVAVLAFLTLTGFALTIVLTLATITLPITFTRRFFIIPHPEEHRPEHSPQHRDPIRNLDNSNTL
ncbi:LysR family transcriptional regulator [Babesia caballi]|uniref:LysR family transcriptional regulator n=1 Tax=Babesia caballi TaxID=5871 RepID=A0AAV4LUH6_BABCB|nr:LysR family transcriptional regulator [Babesia caballi]